MIINLITNYHKINFKLKFLILLSEKIFNKINEMNKAKICELVLIFHQKNTKTMLNYEFLTNLLKK